MCSPCIRVSAHLFLFFHLLTWHYLALTEYLTIPFDSTQPAVTACALLNVQQLTEKVITIVTASLFKGKRVTFASPVIISEAFVFIQLKLLLAQSTLDMKRSECATESNSQAVNLFIFDNFGKIDFAGIIALYNLPSSSGFSELKPPFPDAWFLHTSVIFYD